MTDEFNVPTLCYEQVNNREYPWLDKCLRPKGHLGGHNPFSDTCPLCVKAGCMGDCNKK